MDFGDNICLKLERGYLTMFKQILAALNKSTAEIVYFCEHDVLYDKSHFDFTPPDDSWYYNLNVWKVDFDTGRALKVDDCKQVSGICVRREVAIEHYAKRIRDIEQYTGDDLDDFIRQMGFEPGTHRRVERVDDSTCGTWNSKKPNYDIRHEANLTRTRWTKDQFRNKKYTDGWIESKIDLR